MIKAVGSRVIVIDAAGERHAGVVTYGPAMSRDGERGLFMKYWVRLDDYAEDEDDDIPWPVEDVYPADDERVSLAPLDPETALRAILKVDPKSDPVA